MPIMPLTHNPRINAPKHVGAAKDTRGSTERGYNYRWQQARKRFLKKNPLCAKCLSELTKRITEATEVDHIVPHKNSYALFWDETNWQSLCKTCHSRKTASENGGFGNA